MTIERDSMTDPRMQAAVAELQKLILGRYPSTVFTVGEAEDPDGVYMRAIVDVDDPDEVADVFIDRMIDLQVEDGLPIYVVPVRTPERRAAPRRASPAASGSPDDLRVAAGDPSQAAVRNSTETAYVRETVFHVPVAPQGT